MNDMFGVIQWGRKRAAFWCALFALVSNSPHAMARSQHTETQASGAELAFLSGSKDEVQPPAEATPSSLPKDDGTNFDGAWTFASAGCPYTGSLPAKIVGGKIVIRGGSGHVDPDGTLHSVGAGKRHDPYGLRTIVRKYRFWNVQPIRRLYRQLDCHQAGNVARPPTVGRAFPDEPLSRLA